jgi:group I intron endonuclease
LMTDVSVSTFVNSNNLLYSSMADCGIYEIRHVASGRCYVGSSAKVGQRWRQHRSDLNNGKHHSVYLQRAWDKYGASAFAFSVVEGVENTDDLLAREQYHIDRVNATDSRFGFNVGSVAGSRAGVRHSTEVRARLSALMLARPQEVWDRMAATKRGKKLGPCSAERKAKIGAANRGRIPSAETREKLAQAKRGRVLSDAVRAKMQKSQLLRRAGERAGATR